MSKRQDRRIQSITVSSDRIKHPRLHGPEIGGVYDDELETIVIYDAPSQFEFNTVAAHELGHELILYAHEKRPDLVNDFADASNSEGAISFNSLLYYKKGQLEQDKEFMEENFADANVTFLGLGGAPQIAQNLKMRHQTDFPKTYRAWRHIHDLDVKGGL